MNALLLSFLLFPLLPGARTAPPVQVRKIWDKAPHNAFTDLTFWKGKFYCVFREASAHVGGTDGKIRVLVTKDGEKWTSAALLEEKGIDLRDPKICPTPRGDLMITCGGSDYSDGLQEWHTRVAYSKDGKKWTPPRRVRGIPSNNRFFRLTWHKGWGWAAPNITGSDPWTGRVRSRERRTALYRTRDGMNYELVLPALPLPPLACEVTIRFKPDDTMVLLVREGSWSRRGFLCLAKPPYRNFQVHAITHGMGGPNLLYLGKDKWLVGTREYPYERPPGKKGTATVLLEVDEKGAWRRLLELPSGGDTSYPGFLLRGHTLWISYYSSHQGKTAVYLARLPFPF
ncbi:MAG TPA: exo-alpha-sialidase [Planctomycetes bacterium]|nr:exo-alpha-sialidase [Planctomycetota bacterium]